MSPTRQEIIPASYQAIRLTDGASLDRLREIGGIRSSSWAHTSASSHRWSVTSLATTVSLVSFEPVLESFERLSAELASGTWWTGHQLALGSTDASLKLHTYGSTVFDSFRDVNEPGQEIFPGGELPTLARVGRGQTADEVVEYDGPILSKSDTQRYDLEVLAGATARIDTRCILQQVKSLVNNVGLVLVSAIKV